MFNRSYCTAGVTSSTPCPPGTYGAITGLATIACSGLCGLGYATIHFEIWAHFFDFMFYWMAFGGMNILECFYISYNSYCLTAHIVCWVALRVFHVLSALMGQL